MARTPAPLPGRRGWPGRARGATGLVEPPAEFRATTVQACGFWPFAVGTGAPRMGVPIGHHLHTGETVCCDPITYFRRAGLIPNPSALIIALPGYGKSTAARRIQIGLAALGVNPFVVGDLKGEHVPVIRALGGKVVQLGRGQGALNVLDPGAGRAAAQRLTGEGRHKLTADILGRRLNVVCALIALNRRGPVADIEEAVLSVCLSILDDRLPPGHATLHELAALLEEGPEAVRAMTLERGDDSRYRAMVDPLQLSVRALTDGALGQSFAQRTTVELDLSVPMAVDISGIAECDERLVAATLLATWAEGFGAITAAHALAEAGLAPQRNWLVVMDELWRVLRSGAAGMVARIDALTRLDRSLGTGTLLITHSVSDFLAFPDPADALRAKGFVERVALKIVGAVPPAEIADLRHVIGFSDTEAALVTGWSSPPSWEGTGGEHGAPPGRGQFLIKLGGRPGIPVRIALTERELALNNTNQRWEAP